MAHVTGRQYRNWILLPLQMYHEVLNRAHTRWVHLKRRQAILGWHRRHPGRRNPGGLQVPSFTQNVRGNALDWSKEPPGDTPLACRGLVGVARALVDYLHANRWKLFVLTKLRRKAEWDKYDVQQHVRWAVERNKVYFAINVRGPFRPLYAEGDTWPTVTLQPEIPASLKTHYLAHPVYRRHSDREVLPYAALHREDAANRTWTVRFLARLAKVTVKVGDVAWSILPLRMLNDLQREFARQHRLELRSRLRREDYGERELAFLQDEEPRADCGRQWPSEEELDELALAGPRARVTNSHWWFRRIRG